MSKEALLVKAFTQDPEKGNPAGVIIDAQGLTEDQMVHISADLGFSESAFLFPSDQADYRIRFFTPTKEVPLCGHATIASFYALISEGKVDFSNKDVVTLTQETGAGVLSVECHKDGLIVMKQSKPTFFDTVFNGSEIAPLLGITEAGLTDSLIELVSTGGPKLMIPVRSLSVLESIKPNLEGMKEFCGRSEVRGFYPFTQETMEDSDFHARQFNPFAGIDEDPVTGVAAGALGAYAVKHDLLNKTSFVVEQGYFMNKCGKMYVTVNGDEVSVGGYAAIFGKKSL